jgi:tetratricopeptide (TPR) repeat protein
VASAVASGLWGEFPCPWPFVWLDVATICFVAALPLAALLTTAIMGRLGWHRQTMAMVALEVAWLVVLPQMYITARCQHDIQEAVQLAGQSRYGETAFLLRQVLRLRQRATWNGVSIQEAAAKANRMEDELARRVAASLPSGATAGQRVERAEMLAMLGRTAEALAVLDASPPLTDAPACNLRGTIHESQRRWLAARDCYARAWQDGQSETERADRQNQLVRAITGIAFCERKLGRLAEAEAAWQERLSRAPTAESHFLLAQFYEDTQQTQQAQFHAATAMRIDPQRYSAAGQKLLDQLATAHCSRESAGRTRKSVPAAA